MQDISQKCRNTGEDFTITLWEQEFLKKMGFPLPTLCPNERLRRRLAHRNERKLYKSKCDLTGKPIISIYSPDKPFKVYSQDAWWGYDWDPKNYGRDFDFNRPFFEQFHELQLAVPHVCLLNTHGDNSEYCNNTASNRNCYLVFGGDFNEDCMYGIFNMHSQDCLDLYWVNHCQLCYELIDCDDCYNSRYCRNSHNCRDSAFLFECRGCMNCAFCMGLVNKEYHIFNKQYSKDEYEAKLKEYRLDTFSGVEKAKEEFAKFKLEFPHRFAHIVNCENVTGENIVNVKNCTNGFDVTGPAEDLKDVYVVGWDIKDILSCSQMGHKGAELFYESMGCVGGRNSAFCVYSWYSNDIFYSEMILLNSKHLFGCTNMKKAEYCILNKQYTKEEYEAMLPRIVEHMKSTGEWGEFFPIEHSPFAYNESVAQDIFPMSKEEIEAAGLKWLEEEKREIGSGPDIADCIADIGDDILKMNLVCEKTGRPYKINEKEFRFYKKMGIPIPRYAPETRNDVRLTTRNPRHVWDRKCAKCSKDIATSYAPDRPEIVYCGECYKDEIY